MILVRNIYIVTFLEEQKRERGRQENVDRDCVKIKSLVNKELVSSDESELKFEDNFALFFLASGFYIINCNSRCIKAKSDHFSQKKKDFTSDYSKSLTLMKTAREERRLQVLILLLILLPLMSIQISTSNYISKVESITLRKQTPQKNQ